MISFKDKVSNLSDSGTESRLRFLTLAEQAVVKGIIKYNPTITLEGGYQEAERKRALFNLKTPLITCFKIIYNQKHLQLTHQNILGSLLSLNITRDSIGDILPTGGYFFITEEIEQEVLLSFTSINRVPITLEKYDPTDLKSEIKTEEYQTTVASKRLDNIITKIIKKSRTEALEYLQKEYIKVNHQITTKPSKTIKDLDVISVRRFGRYQIIDSNNHSKKGKIIIKYIKFI